MALYAMLYGLTDSSVLIYRLFIITRPLSLSYLYITPPRRPENNEENPPVYLSRLKQNLLDVEDNDVLP